jgi:cysteine synthase A
MRWPGDWREEGMLVGISGSAALVGALQVARNSAKGSVVVTISFDSGGKYLSEHVCDEIA